MEQVRQRGEGGGVEREGLRGVGRATRGGLRLLASVRAAVLGARARVRVRLRVLLLVRLHPDVLDEGAGGAMHVGGIVIVRV